MIQKRSCLSGGFAFLFRILSERSSTLQRLYESKNERVEAGYFTTTVFSTPGSIVMIRSELGMYCIEK
jgi:hypothetical protein